MDELIVFATLDHKHACFQFSDALSLAGKMIDAGFDVVAEAAPGAPISGMNMFYLKTYPAKVEEARKYFEENIIPKGSY